MSVALILVILGLVLAVLGMVVPERSLLWLGLAVAIVGAAFLVAAAVGAGV